MGNIIVAIILLLANFASYRFGKNHERDITAMKKAGRLMRQELHIIPEPSAGQPPEGGKEIPFMGTRVTEYRDPDDVLEDHLRAALADNGPTIIPAESLSVIRERIASRTLYQKVKVKVGGLIHGRRSLE
jgi:hypothetical protein